jgi:hypothetical protein
VLRSRSLLGGDEFATLGTRLIKAQYFTTCFCMSTQSLAFLVNSLHVIIVPTLASSNHKSTQPFVHCYLDAFEDWG